MSDLISLLHRASQNLEETYNRASAQIITPRQRAILDAVTNRKLPSQNDLIDPTGVDRSTIADIVRRLVRDGLLLRTRSRQDQRTYELRLTPAGEQALRHANTVADLAAARFMERLPVTKRAGFIGALEKLAASEDAPVSSKRAA